MKHEGAAVAVVTPVTRVTSETPVPQSGRGKRVARVARRVVPAVLLLATLGAVCVCLVFNRIARREVEQQTTRAINLRTTVSSVAVNPLAGRVQFTDFRIASPPGFATPDMLEVPAAEMRASYGQLRADPVHIPSVTLIHPRLVIEADGLATLNLKRMVERIPHPPHPIRLVIDEVVVRDATVVLRNLPGAPGETSVPVATFTVKNLGADQPGGALIKDVVTHLVTTLAVQASNSPQMPPHYRALIKGDVGAIVRDVIPGEMGRLLSGMLRGGNTPAPSTRPNQETKEPHGLFGSLGSLLGKGRPSSQPASRPDGGGGGDGGSAPTKLLPPQSE